MGTESATRTDALLAPIDVSIKQARDAALALAGHAEDAAELRRWLQMLGLLPYEPGPRADEPPKGCATTVTNYRRPGH